MIPQLQQGQTGKQTGQNIAQGCGEFTEALVTELMPRYYENTYRGQKFSALFASAALAAAAAASTFVIINPAGSGKNLVLMDAYIAFTALTAQAAGTNVILGFTAAPSNPSTVGTVVVTQNGLLGSGNKSVALVYQTATLAAVPTFVRTLSCLYGDLAASDLGGQHDDIGGAVIVAPGNAIVIFGVNGTPADVSVAPSLTWDEVPV